MAIAYLNGVWQAIHEAKISVLDRGFMFGDGVYEVIPVYNNQAFLLEQHLQRLSTSLAEIKISNPMSVDQWVALVLQAVDKGQEANAVVYIQVTRGVAEKREHLWQQNISPTVLLTVSAAHGLARVYSNTVITPYAMVTMDDFRWKNGHIKTTSLLAAGLIKNEAAALGMDDAILIRDGLVTESSSSNVFVVIDGAFVTPPKSCLILHGITRDLVLMLARKSNLVVEERDIEEAELFRASEVMVTSSGRELWPVGSINSKNVGDGAPGMVWKSLDKRFQAYKEGL